jgi:hypothetical protein
MTFLIFSVQSTLYKIIGVCPQIFDSIIHDWLDPPFSPLRAPTKASSGEIASGKLPNGVLVSGDGTKLSHFMR